MLFVPTILGAATAMQQAARVPLTFEPNLGQFSREIRFAGRGPGYRVALTATGASVASHRLQVVWTLVGGNPETPAQTLRPSEGISNYLIGSREHWIRRVPHYGAVRFASVWPGIDVEYYGNPQRFEHDFRLAAGADPSQIRLRFDQRVSVQPDGALLAGGARFDAPFAYQEIAGKRRPVSARYALRHGLVTFALGAYDSSLPLVIDPVLAYSSLLGGANLDLGNSIAVDGNGSAYVAGYTDSRNFPAGLRTFGGNTDAFVAKFNAAGSALVYATYLGGSGEERGRNLVVDPTGSVYLVGETTSTNFPVSSGALQGTYRGGVADAFVVKLSPNGADLVYSTYLGGSEEDSGYGMKVDGVGNAYISGVTASSNFPVTSGALRGTRSGEYDVFVTKLGPAGSTLVYSTYLGGNGFDSTDANLALDSSGSVYVTGETNSTDFPATAGAYQRVLGGTFDAFVVKLNPAGTALTYGTLLGGGNDDVGLGIAVDSTGSAYVSGTTLSQNFPVTAAAVQRTFAGGDYDAFVVKLNPAGSALDYSTYLGGSGFEDAWSIAVDAGGIAHVVGTTGSPNFPVTGDALQTTFGGGDSDVFVVRLSANGGALTYGTYIGWTGFDEGFNVALDASRSIYITGVVDPLFPTTPGAFATTHAGGDGDAFVLKISDDQASAPAPVISSGGILNGAGFGGGPIAPGEIIAIFGENIGPAAAKVLKLTSTNRVDTNLGATRVLFDDVAAPLIFVSERQINAVVPYEVAGKGAVNVVVVNRGIRSSAANVPVAQAAPAIFTQNAQGNGQGSILNQDLSINSSSNGAARGSIVAIYATGGGQTNPPLQTGSVPTGQTTQAAPVTVTLGGMPAEVVYAGNAPTLVAGVLQLNVRVPELPAGNHPVVVSVGGQASSQNVTLAVR